MVRYHFIGDDSLVEQITLDSSLNNLISNSILLGSEPTAIALLSETPGPSHRNPNSPLNAFDDEENQISEYGLL